MLLWLVYQIRVLRRLLGCFFYDHVAAATIIATWARLLPERICWNDDQASYCCGVFSGLTRVGMSSIGNSVTRSCILLTVSWLIWVFKKDLRVTLSFGHILEVQEWMKWVAFGFRVYITLHGFMGVWIMKSCEHNTTAAMYLFHSFYGTTVSALILRHLLYGGSLKLFFLLRREVFFLVALYLVQLLLGWDQTILLLCSIL